MPTGRVLVLCASAACGLLVLGACKRKEYTVITAAAGQCTLQPAAQPRARMASTGVVAAKVLFVDFSDVPASGAPAAAFALVSPGAGDFFNAMSYGRMDYRLHPELKWVRMSKPSSGYSFATHASHRAYLQEAIDLAGPGVDYKGMQAVYVIAPPDVAHLANGPAYLGGWAASWLNANGIRIYNGATSGADLRRWGHKWLNHEAGHTMGLPDLYAFEGQPHRFTGQFGVMGDIDGGAAEMFAYERWKLGWLDTRQVVCQQGGQQTTALSPIEKAGGIKAVMVPTGASTALMVESRRASGYDSRIAQEGALVYLIDTGAGSGNGPTRVIGPGGLPTTMTAGQSLTVGKVTVHVVSAGADGDTVTVRISEKTKNQ